MWIWTKQIHQESSWWDRWDRGSSGGDASSIYPASMGCRVARSYGLSKPNPRSLKGTELLGDTIRLLDGSKYLAQLLKVFLKRFLQGWKAQTSSRMNRDEILLAVALYHLAML